MSPLDISLTDLIARLDEELPESDALTRVGEARLRAQTLSSLGDQLIDHYVNKARRTGASWTEIGDAIGVSKQAAQQRHAAGPFGRYTYLNRHGIVLAQEAARTHRHDLISTEHLLLGLLGERQGLAHELLVGEAGSEERVREAVEETLPPAGAKAPRGHIAFAPESKEAIEEAGRVADDLGHDRIGTEHALLGLIRVERSPAARILRDLGFTSDGLRETVRAEVARRSADDER
ncbi:Clp protease N-terminal domain-containing protein [Streptomyces sp. NPDC005438]|uniref:Clp protease N-terminal domain-containing protein n=1 Tax=Streptomyces sp. NPDC005438 TaxID=3156880 RepID=UPI0033A37DBA